MVIVINFVIVGGVLMRTCSGTDSDLTNVFVFFGSCNGND